MNPLSIEQLQAKGYKHRGVINMAPRDSRLRPIGGRIIYHWFSDKRGNVLTIEVHNERH